MLSSIRRRLPFRGHGPWIVIASVLVALLVTPFALAAGENRPLRGGARNPSPNASLSFTRETQIIANNSDLRHPPVEQVDHAAAARSTAAAPAPARTRACGRSNLSNGRAFSFATNSGTEVGRIDGPSTAAPFTTSATGVATGLNADKVDGKDAADDRGRREPLRARSPRAGALGNQRGATSARPLGRRHVHRRLLRRHLEVRARRDCDDQRRRRRSRPRRSAPTTRRSTS